MLPDIVFLPTSATVYALNEPVPLSKPRLVVSSAAVQQARQPHARHSPAGARTAGRRAAAAATAGGGARSADAGSPSAAVAAEIAAQPASPQGWLHAGRPPLELFATPVARRDRQAAAARGSPLLLSSPPQLALPPLGDTAPLLSQRGPLVPLPLGQVAALVAAMLQQVAQIAAVQEQPAATSLLLPLPLATPRLHQAAQPVPAAQPAAAAAAAPAAAAAAAAAAGGHEHEAAGQPQQPAAMPPGNPAPPIEGAAGPAAGPETLAVPTPCPTRPPPPPNAPIPLVPSNIDHSALNSQRPA